MDLSAVGVYAITNKENGKTYIGSAARSFRIRWNEHRSNLRCNDHCNPYLQSSWNKYGEDVFEFGILEYLDDLDEIYLAEQFWMNIYREEGKELYNVGKYAYNARRGVALSEELKHKISESNKGVRRSKETKQKMSLAKKGKPGRRLTKETRDKISKAHIGRKRGPMTEEHKRKISESNRGKKHGPMTEETKRKLREANKEANLGKKRSDKTRQKISAALKGRSSSRKGCILSEEHKQKISDSMINYWNRRKHGEDEAKVV